MFQTNINKYNVLIILLKLLKGLSIYEILIINDWLNLIIGNYCWAILKFIKQRDVDKLYLVLISRIQILKVSAFYFSIALKQSYVSYKFDLCYYFRSKLNKFNFNIFSRFVYF